MIFKASNGDAGYAGHDGAEAERDGGFEFARRCDDHRRNQDSIFGSGYRLALTIALIVWKTFSLV